MDTDQPTTQTASQPADQTQQQLQSLPYHMCCAGVSAVQTVVSTSAFTCILSLPCCLHISKQQLCGMPVMSRLQHHWLTASLPPLSRLDPPVCCCCCCCCCDSPASPSTCSAFEPDATRYLLLLALVPSSLGVLLSLGLNYVPFVETSEVAAPTSRWSARSR